MSFAALLLLCVPAAEMSEWSDASGDFSVTAEFVKLDGETVVLRDEEGDELEVPLEALSAADRRRAEKLAKAGNNPFQKRAKPSPFQKKRSSRSARDRDEPDDEPAAADARSIRVRPGDARTLDVDGVDASLSLTAADVSPQIDLPRQGLRIKAKISIHDSDLGTAVSPLGGKAVLGIGIHKFSDEAEGGALTVIDLADGRAGKPFRTKEPEAALHVTSDGTSLLTRRAVWGHGSSERLTSWSLGRTPSAEWTMVPFADERAGLAQDITWAARLSEEVVAVVNAYGLLRVIDTGRGNVTHEFEMPRYAAASVSADGRYLVVPGDEQIAVYDAASMRPVGAVPIEGDTPRAATLTVDNSRLMVADARDLRVYDTSDASLIDALTHGAVLPTTQETVLAHAGGPFYFVGTRLVDLESHIPVWTYEGASHATSFGEETLLLYTVMTQAPDTVLAVAGPLPHPPVRRIRDEAVARPGLLALKPGDRVKVDVAGLPDASKRAGLKTSLEEAARERGFVIDDSSTKVMQLSMTRGAQQKQKYSRFGGFGGGGEEVTFRPYLGKLRITVDGREVWSREQTVGGPGFMISVKDGESMQQAARRLEKPNYESLAAMRPPMYVPDQAVVKQDGLGLSRVGRRGLEDVPAQ